MKNSESFILDNGKYDAATIISDTAADKVQFELDRWTVQRPQIPLGAFINCDVVCPDTDGLLLDVLLFIWKTRPARSRVHFTL